MKSKIISSAIALSALLSVATPAFAQVGLGANANVNASVNGTNASVNVNADAKARMEQNRQQNMQQRADDRMDKGMDRGDKEISNRIDSLTQLQARIQGMKNLSDSQKASFSASIQTQITAMNTLLAKIKADTSTTSLKADLQTIAPAYGIYMLIHPQLSIMAAADRVGTIVTMLQTLGTKFDARLAAHANAGASAKLADMKAKIADANVQAQAATSLVINLQPDNGVQSVMDANNAALKSARAKLKLASDDIKAAYADARSIAASLKADAKVTASSTTSTN